jgi:hypothetical protein
MTTQTLLILRSARDAWRDILEGKVFYSGKPVFPFLPIWSNIQNYYCTVCVAAAYYLQQHGSLLDCEQVTWIEEGLDCIRQGRHKVIYRLNEQGGPLNNFLSEVLSIWPEDQYTEIVPLRWIEEDLAQQSCLATEIVPPRDRDNSQYIQVLALLNLLVSNLELKQIQTVSAPQSVTVQAK